MIDKNSAYKVAVFNALVSTRHNEATIIWQRYSAMLVANSMLLLFFRTSTNINFMYPIVIVLFGLFLCVL